MIKKNSPSHARASILKTHYVLATLQCIYHCAGWRETIIWEKSALPQIIPTANRTSAVAATSHLFAARR